MLRKCLFLSRIPGASERLRLLPLSAGVIVDFPLLCPLRVEFSDSASSGRLLHYILIIAALVFKS